MRKTIFRYDLDKLSVDEINYLRKKIPVDMRQEICKAVVNNGMVDIFDFMCYAKEYKLMAQYYQGLTLYLKTSLLIDYKYNHNSIEGRELFVRSFDAKKTAKEKRAYLDLMFDVVEPEYIIHHFYRHYAPEKTAIEVDKIFEKYSAAPSTMFNCAYRVYVDKQWKNEDLWFA